MHQSHSEDSGQSFPSTCRIGKALLPSNTPTAFPNPNPTTPPSGSFMATPGKPSLPPLSRSPSPACSATVGRPSSTSTCAWPRKRERGSTGAPISPPTPTATASSASRQHAANLARPIAFEDSWSLLSAPNGRRPKSARSWSAAAGDQPPARSLEDWAAPTVSSKITASSFIIGPFIWHIWDGRKDGFHALVNYHRLAGPKGEGRRTLEALTYSYLGDWIARQKSAQRKEADGTQEAEGADARLAAAQDLKGQLEKILCGEPPYDIFVRWKSLHEQPVGWDPDINDGVRLNIRPFLRAELRTGGRRGAGVLRWKPNINWRKGSRQGAESLRPKSDFPWFWSCPGERRRPNAPTFRVGMSSTAIGGTICTTLAPTRKPHGSEPERIEGPE